MPINKQVYDLCAEVLTDRDIHGERHHIRGRAAGKQLGAINDLLIVGVIPVPAGHSETVHLHGKPRDALVEYVRNADIDELRNIILAAYDQADLILTRGVWRSL